MTRKLLPGYRFTTDAQWKTCLFVGADRETRGNKIGFCPFAPYGGPARRFETKGGHAPAISDMGDVWWRDEDGYLQRLAYGDDTPHAMSAPFAIARAKRLVATSSFLWAPGDDGSLQAFDADSLSRELVVSLPDLRFVDIAGDGHDGIYALAVCDGVSKIVHLTCTGEVKASFSLDGVADASELVHLARPGKLVVLASGSSKLYWFTSAGGPPASKIATTAIRPCFDVAALGSDGRARLFLAGSDNPAFGGRHWVLTLDSEGNVLGELEIKEGPTGTVGNRTHQYVTANSGLLRFEAGTGIPPSSAEVRATLLTPMLESPANRDLQRWLRIEATAKLPAGCALEISYASTSDPEVRDAMRRLFADRSLPEGMRIEEFRRELGPWRTISFHGAGLSTVEEAATLSAPLFDIRDPYLWVAVTLIASPGGGVPVLSQLAVLYPGVTLLENLPAIYRRAEAESGDLLRSFVGVLEATTQTLDARIATLGRNIHPQSADDRWLDYIARWLGLPWDNALSLAQKRQIALHAADIANGYGTRAGLEALLASLMPETPRRFRVVDSTVDFGLATVGGGDCAGSRLPAVLSGLPVTATELGNKAILGRARLPSSDGDSGSARLIGRIRVDVSATAEEREAWQPWLRTLVDSMVPATTRVELRWLSAIAFGQDMELDEGLTLDGPPTAHLGTDAVTGIARLAGKGGVSLSRSGHQPNPSL